MKTQPTPEETQRLIRELLGQPPHYVSVTGEECTVTVISVCPDQHLPTLNGVRQARAGDVASTPPAAQTMERTVSLDLTFGTDQAHHLHEVHGDPRAFAPRVRPASPVARPQPGRSQPASDAP